MTPTHKIVYRLLIQMIVLLLLYALAALLGALKFLSPDDALGSLPYNQVGALGNILLQLAVLTGLLGGGVYAAVTGRADARLPHDRLLRVGAGLWTALLALAVIAGLLGVLDGRHLLELPPLLAALQIAAAGLIGMAVMTGAPRLPAVRVWLVGLGISLLAALAGLIIPGDFIQARALQTLAAGMIIYVAYPLMAVALGFWLMQRFSNVTPAWADTGIYNVAGLVTAAGVLLVLPPFYALEAAEWVGTLGTISAVVIPVCYLIFAAHGYRALSDRNPTQTLAAHWFALALLLFLLGPALLGALQAVPDISRYTLGTRLSDLQTTLTAFAPAALALGVANQAAAELRGHNRRVTGFIPFWLAAFGMVIAGLALGAAGVAQTYLERLLSVGYLDTQTLLSPLYTLWLGGLALAALGLVIYALTFWRRRPVA